MALLVFKTSGPHYAGGGFDSHPLPPILQKEDTVRSFLLAFLLALLGNAGGVRADPSRTLTTQFTYTATVPAPPAGTKTLDVWLPIPSDNAYQTIQDLTVTAPAEYQITREPKYENRMVYLQLPQPAGPLTVTVQFTAERLEAQAAGSAAGLPPAAYLMADSRVPIGGRFAQIAQQVTRKDRTAKEKEHDLFQSVVATMQYDYKKVSPRYAQGDSAFVCDYKSGNCSDLHSYLISLSRSIGIPAVLEFGFPLTGIPVTQPLPTEGNIPGYHCWMWFFDPDNGPTPVDAADARRWTDAGHADVARSLFGRLVLERSAVAVSRGRDLTLSPPQKSGPLNYFIYPYAEADGLPLTASWKLNYHVLAGPSR